MTGLIRPRLKFSNQKGKSFVWWAHKIICFLKKGDVTSKSINVLRFYQISRYSLRFQTRMFFACCGCKEFNQMFSSRISKKWPKVRHAINYSPLSVLCVDNDYYIPSIVKRRSRNSDKINTRF